MTRKGGASSKVYLATQLVGDHMVKLMAAYSASEVRQKCLYTIRWVAVRDDFFFLKSFVCARAMKTPSSGTCTAGVPPDTGPSLRTYS